MIDHRIYPILRCVIAACALTAMALNCSNSGSGSNAAVFVSIPPYLSIARRIASGRFDVHVLAGPDQSPHSFSPSPAQMAQLADARIFFRCGVEYERSVVPKMRETMPHLKIVDLRDGVAMRAIDGADGHHGHHGHHGHDAHTDHERDPHVWLSPRIMKEQAATMRTAFTQADPAGTELYESGFKAVSADLDSLDRYLRGILDPLRGSDLFVFHPAFGYFADAYGLHQVAVEIDGKEPGAKALARVFEKAKARRPGVIFVQPQYSQKSARAVAARIGCAVVPINPLPRNYLAEMRTMGEAVEDGLSKRK